jgi:hypothetical protein
MTNSMQYQNSEYMQLEKLNRPPIITMNIIHLQSNKEVLCTIDTYTICFYYLKLQTYNHGKNSQDT